MCTLSRRFRSVIVLYGSGYSQNLNITLNKANIFRRILNQTAGFFNAD